jgi:hypothetical protein
MKLNEIIIIVLIILLVLGALWYRYLLNIQIQKEADDQRLQALKVARTNIQGTIVHEHVEPNMLDKTDTETYPDEIGFPEPSGKGVKQLTPEQSMIDTYYTNATHIDVPLNNKQLPIGSCPFSRPMSKDLPLANVPMCMAVDNDSNMRIDVYK